MNLEDYSMGYRLREIMKLYGFAEALHLALHGDTMDRTGLDGEIYRHYYLRRSLIPDHYGGTGRLADLIMTTGSGVDWLFAHDPLH